MTFSQSAVEAAARALYIAMDSFEKGVQVDSLTPDEHAYLAKVALTAALAVDGVALVPREPTAEMFCAAVPFPAHLVHERDDPTYTKRMEAATLADRLHARQIWLDMLSAASEGEERK